MSLLNKAMLTTGLLLFGLVNTISSEAKAYTESPDNQDLLERGGVGSEQAKGYDADDAIRLDAVRVQARRVEELSQEVPLPVTAITSETIQAKGMDGLEDIARFAPGLTFHGFYGRTNDRPIIRGQISILGQSNASTFIDGVFVQGDISGYDLSNVEQVEVIRGPQSALFGRRTFSGAINYITKSPSSAPQGGVTLQLGNYGQEQARFNYSSPISDSLSFAFNAYNNRTDGLFYNSVSEKKDLGGRKSSSFGGSLHFNPNDSFTATLRLNYQEHKDQPQAQYPMGFARSNCNGAFTGEYLGAVPIYTGRAGVCGELSIPRDAQFAINTTDFELAGLWPGVKGRANRSSLSMTYSFPNFWELTSVTSYNDESSYRAQDQDYRAIRGGSGLYETYSYETSHDFSQELRLTTDEELPLHGLIGAYYFSQGDGYGYKGDLGGFNLIPGQPGNSLEPVIPNITTPSYTVKNRALFGLVEYRFNDMWKASAEVRRAEDVITNNGIDRQSLVIDGEREFFENSYNSQEKFSSTMPRFTVSYKASEDLNFYLLRARGNKPGGFNVGIQDARYTEESRQAALAAGMGTYKEETAWTTELGLKSTWLNGRLRLNADIFNIDWTNQQVSSSNEMQYRNGLILANSTIMNIGKSRIRGLEVEGEYLLSRNWLLTYAYTYLDTKVITYIDPDFVNSIGTVDAAGRKLRQVPEHKGAFGLMYTETASNGWGVFGNIDISYESLRYGISTEDFWVGPTTTVNIRVGIEPLKNVRLTAFINNAFDDRTPNDMLRYIDLTATRIAYPDLVAGSGYLTNYPRDAVLSARLPRMFGIRLDYRF